MSNLKVLVEFDSPTVFAGEELKCTITFRNTATDPSQPLNGITSSQSRAPSATPTGALRGKEWGAPTRAGRPPPILADSKKKPGHRQTVSLNAPSTNRLSSNPNTPTTDRTSRRGSQTPKNNHSRSISIVSHGSVENGTREGPTSGKTAAQRRGSHTRAASYHGSPNKNTSGASGMFSKANGGPLSAGMLSAGMRSPRAPPLVRAATAHAAKASVTHTDPSRSPLLRGMGDDIDEALADEAYPTTDNNSLTPNASVSAPMRQRPFPSPLPHRDRMDNAPLQRVLSPMGTEATPRSSLDLMSTYSEDTMASEYINAIRGAQQPRHARHASQLSTVSSAGAQVESLMMAYVQLQGSFVLDGSLIDQGPFEAAKQMGVIGGQGSGGVVGVGTPTKRNSGILGSFGLGSIGSSFSGILGGQDLSSMRDMKGIANTKSVPLISTPQSILFVDLQLGPGQSKSFSYKHKLPPDLPPTHKGRAIKIEYQVTVGTQRAQTVGQKNNMRQVKIPFRLFPAVSFDGSLIPHDLMVPHVILRDSATTKAVDDRWKKPSVTSDKQTSIIKTKFAFLAYTDQLLQSSQNNAGEALLSPTEARRESRLLLEDTEEDSSDSFPMRELVEMHVTRPPMGSDPSTGRSTNTFAIQRAGKPVAVISIVRPSYRLGDTVTAVVDLSGSYSHVFTLNVVLETEEIVDEGIALRSASSIRRATRKIYSHASEVTINQKRAVFGFMIPWNATPDFLTSGIRLEWKLRFEFITSVAPKAEEDLMEEVGRDERGSLYAALQELYTESFEVGVPLKVFGAEGGYIGRKDTEHSI